MTTVFNIRSFGAVGDGYTNDQPAIANALLCAIGCSGAVYFPPGLYLCDAPISHAENSARISLFGDGANVSTILFRNTCGIDLTFAQHAAQQPFGVTIRNLGVRALGACNTGIRISYGTPPVTNDHNQPSCAFSNVQVTSDPEGSWKDGIVLEGAWNPTLENVFISGDSKGGVWNDLVGAGVTLLGMCVNAHLSNVRCNFFADGIRVHSSDNRNTEGIFCSNCSMVGVQRGVWLRGDALVPNAPRISTFTWTGGLIECRVGGVTADKVSAAIFLESVWTALISSAQFLAESIPTIEGKYTYGVVVKNSAGVVVTGCDLNAWSFGFHSAEACRALAATGCTFTNVETQVVFAPGCVDSRSYGHVLFNNAPKELSFDASNKIGFNN